MSGVSHRTAPTAVLALQLYSYFTPYSVLVKVSKFLILFDHWSS